MPAQDKTLLANIFPEQLVSDRKRTHWFPTHPSKNRPLVPSFWRLVSTCHATLEPGQELISSVFVDRSFPDCSNLLLSRWVCVPWLAADPLSVWCVHDRWTTKMTGSDLSMRHYPATNPGCLLLTACKLDPFSRIQRRAIYPPWYRHVPRSRLTYSGERFKFKA